MKQKLSRQEEARAERATRTQQHVKSVTSGMRYLLQVQLQPIDMDKILAKPSDHFVDMPPAKLQGCHLPMPAVVAVVVVVVAINHIVSIRSLHRIPGGCIL